MYGGNEGVLKENNFINTVSVRESLQKREFKEKVQSNKGSDSKKGKQNRMNDEPLLKGC